MKSASIKGFIATVILLVVYFTLLTFISGWGFAVEQFSQFWYFVIALAVGFGIQVGLYSYLKSLVKSVSAGMVATSGITSTAAMISCCTHYLVNILPILGAVGIVTIISQYQVEFFWVGLAFNLMGIAYMYFQLTKHKKMMQTNNNPTK